MESNPIDSPLTGSIVPLTSPGFIGETTRGLVGYRSVPTDGTTASKFSDYTPATNRVWMPPYVSSAVIQINIENDDIVEYGRSGSGEDLMLTLFAPRYESVRYSTAGMFVDGNVKPLQNETRSIEAHVLLPYQFLLLSVNVSAELREDDDITLLGSKAIVKSCNGTHVELKPPFWSPPSGYAPFVDATTNKHGIPMYKISPSLGTESARLTILNDDPAEVVDKVESGTTVNGTYLDFGSNGNLTVVTAEDVTNYIFEGDTVILLRHNDNSDPNNRIAQPSFVSHVESVERRSLTMNTTISPHNLDMAGEYPHTQAQHVSDWTNVDIYVGATPDHPGGFTIE